MSLAETLKEVDFPRKFSSDSLNLLVRACNNALGLEILLEKRETMEVVLMTIQKQIYSPIMEANCFSSDSEPFLVVLESNILCLSKLCSGSQQIFKFNDETNSGNPVIDSIRCINVSSISFNHLNFEKSAEMAKKAMKKLETNVNLLNGSFV